MLALCLMLLATHYAQNYAGIIGWSLDACFSVHISLMSYVLQVIVIRVSPGIMFPHHCCAELQHTARWLYIYIRIYSYDMHA